MSVRVSISTASPFLALVARKALAGLRRVQIAGDHRGVDAARRAFAEPGLALVDAELLSDPDAGATLSDLVAARRDPTIVLDPRGACGPDAFATSPAVVVLRGQRKGELDLDAIESGLASAVAVACRTLSAGDRDGAEPVTSRTSAPEPHDGPLELIVIGVSTGGPTVLLRLVAALDAPTVPVLIVQHMPESETRGLAARLAEESRGPVVEVANGPLPPAGTIGVLRGGSDVRIARRADGTLALRSAVLDGNPYHPNVDEVLLSAVAAGVAVGAVILTGMGADGAAGALALSKKGLPVIAQRPATCAVAGMPQAVIDAGAARLVQAPDAIARTLNRWFAEASAPKAVAGGAR